MFETWSYDIEHRNNDVDDVENMSTNLQYLRGSCQCPKAGKGGYETYNNARRHFDNLWSNVTNIYSHIRANRDKIKTKCPETRCNNTLTKVKKLQDELDTLKTVNVSALEEKMITMMALIEELQAKVSSNTASTATNAAAIANKCDTTKCGSLETDVNNIENCFGDVTSTDCPSSSTGKSGIISSIAATTTALSTKCESSKCDALQVDLDKVESCFSDKTSTDCPSATPGKVSVTDAIKTLEEPPVFNCGFFGGDFSTTGTLSPFTCDVNEGSVVDPSTGVFTVPKDGKYRLTFMARTVPLNKKKVFCIFIKTSSGTETKIGRSVAQTKVGNEQEQITTTIDIIHQLSAGETVHVLIQVSGGPKINGDDNLPQQVTFTGEFIRS